MNAAVNERVAVEKRNGDLAQELMKTRRALRYFGVTNIENLGKQPPNPLTGVVTAVPQPALVEVSLGSDDGLRKGHQLDVTRGGSYIGRIEVMEATPECAACRVDPKMLRKPIERGDRVRLEPRHEVTPNSPLSAASAPSFSTVLLIIVLLAILPGVALLWGHMKSTNKLREAQIKHETTIAERDAALCDASAAMNAALETVKIYQARVAKLEADLKGAQIERDARSKDVVRLTDGLNAAVNERRDG